MESGMVSTTSQPTATTTTSKPVLGSYNPFQRTMQANSRVTAQPVNSGTPAYSAPPVGTTSSPYSSTTPRSSPVDRTRPGYENVDQFDFNRNYEDQLDQLRRSQADLQQQNDLENQRLNEDYGRQFRDVRNAQTEALDFDAEKMAGQGILRSGIAVKSAGNIGAKYGGELDVLQRQLSGQLENRGAAFAQAQRQIQEQIGRAQEAATRQQQELEQARARQLAAAEAAQRAAQAAATQSAAKPAGNLIQDNRGRYFLVDPTNMTRSEVTGNNLQAATSLYGPATTGLKNAGALFGQEYVANANALARRLGGNLGGQASLDTRLGFRDIGAWR